MIVNLRIVIKSTRDNKIIKYRKSTWYNRKFKESTQKYRTVEEIQ